MRLSSFGEGKAAPGLKSLISAAIWQSKPDASNDVILSMPHPPASRLAQNVSICWPSGVTTPSPVTTTLRSIQLLAIK